MKGRVLEKIAAVVCALALAVGVMSGAVFAKDEDGAPEPAAPEATFVIVDLDLDGSPADASYEAEAASGTEAAADTPAPAFEVTDNRASVPLLVNGEAAGECPIVGGVPYADAAAFCGALGLRVIPRLSGDTYALSGDLDLRAAAGDIYFICNGRYILAEDGVILRDGQALLPVEALAKCLGVAAAWDRVQWSVSMTAEAVHPLESGGVFYSETDVYWLSRVIYAEAGSQSLRGQIAVGNVVMNRISDERFAAQNSVYDVIFAKNQFDVVVNGMIYMEPDDSAVIAAKLALEGFDVSGGATYFATYDFGEGYRCVMWIDDHCFMTEA